jgi:hypothetical protein
MTDDGSENTSRRALAYATAVTHAVSNPATREKMGMDPEPSDSRTKLRLALGAAYSDLYLGIGRQVIIKRLQALLAIPEIAAVVRGHHAHLAAIVAARSRGDQCGDHISKIQHELLTAALDQIPEPPNAA